MTNSRPLIAIVGPTASGKSALGLELALRYGGEIICADSRTVYRGLDIGTAKPTIHERRLVPHHLIDVINPDERLSAATFKELALTAMEDIRQRDKIPFLVGGSGLYIDAVLFDYRFPGPPDLVRRQELDSMSTKGLLELLAVADPEARDRIDRSNRRRVIRAIETAGQPRQRQLTVRPQTLLLGINPHKEFIQKRIEQRIDIMLAQGFLDEVVQIGTAYGWDSPALDVIGYKAFKPVALGRATPAEGRRNFVQGDMKLWKKQVTWFRRNPAIKWLDVPGQAEALVHDFLRYQDRNQL